MSQGAAIVLAWLSGNPELAGLDPESTSDLASRIDLRWESLTRDRDDYGNAVERLGKRIAVLEQERDANAFERDALSEDLRAYRDVLARLASAARGYLAATGGATPNAGKGPISSDEPMALLVNAVLATEAALANGPTSEDGVVRVETEAVEAAQEMIALSDEWNAAMERGDPQALQAAKWPEREAASNARLRAALARARSGR